MSSSARRVSSLGEPMSVLASELIVVLDLSGLDKDSAELIMDTILKDGFLDKRGVKGSGDAVLFMVVNEALQRLAEIRNELLAPPSTSPTGQGTG